MKSVVNTSNDAFRSVPTGVSTSTVSTECMYILVQSFNQGTINVTIE